MTDLELMIKESDISNLDKYIIKLGNLSGIKALRLILEAEEILRYEKI